jgi:hypothetical protein
MQIGYNEQPAGALKALLPVYQITRSYIQGGHNPNADRRENVKPHNSWDLC